jgi:hypothetical protein
MIKYFHNLQKLGFFMALFIFYANTMLAQTTAGNASFNFLTLPYSAKATALGGMNISALGSDLGLAMFTPSLLNKEMNGQLQVGINPYFAGIQQYDMIGVRYWEQQHITTGLGVHFLDYGNISMTDIAGNELGTMHPNDYAIQFSVATNYIQHFTIGSTLKFIQSNYGMYKSSGLAMDIGLTYLSPNKLMQSSILVTNLGTQITTNGTKQDLPFNLILGWSKKLEYAPIQFSITADRLSVWNRSYYDPQYADIYGTSPASSLQNLFNHLTLGTQLYIGEQVDVNLGYHFIRRYDLNVYNQSNGLNGLSAGLGFKLDRLQLQYGNSFFQTNLYHHFSVSYQVVK